MGADLISNWLTKKEKFLINFQYFFVMFLSILELLSESTVEKEPEYLHPLLNFFEGCVNTSKKSYTFRSGFFN